MGILFWTAVAIVGYTYVIYPATVWIVSRFRRAPVAGQTVRPSISIILSLYNEEAHVEHKIKNLLSLDYPRDRIQILVGSDGSTDRTNDILRQYGASSPVTVICQPHRAGKPAMLNALATLATGELLVFTDARQRVDPHALKDLVGHFEDAAVGSVSAKLHFEESIDKPAEGVGLYWSYETFIRTCESRLGSMLGATGALYVIRRELYSPVPPGLVLDDVYIPLKVVERGYRALFEPEARIYDQVVSDAPAEFARKTRTLAGNFQLFRFFPWALNPFNGIVAWQFFSHKVLRLVVPYCLLALLAANLFLLDGVFYRATLVLQALFYALALAGVVAVRPFRLFDVPHMFCVLNWAAVVGLYRYATDRQDVLWEKTSVG